MLRLEAEAAQGGGDATKLAAEQTKLDKNIAQDVAEAGNTATDPGFDGKIAA